MQLATERTRLYVEGVRAAITAEVARRRQDGLVVTQALPFLRLDTPVTADGGTRARIARVAISMECDVPRLMLELVHDQPLAAPVTEPDDTLESFTPGVSVRPARTDSTVPYDFLRSERETEVRLTPEPPAAAIVRAAPRAPWWSSLLSRVRALISVLARRVALG